MALNEDKPLESMVREIAEEVLWKSKKEKKQKKFKCPQGNDFPNFKPEICRENEICGLSPCPINLTYFIIHERIIGDYIKSNEFYNAYYYLSDLIGKLNISCLWDEQQRNKNCLTYKEERTIKVLAVELEGFTEKEGKIFGRKAHDFSKNMDQIFKKVRAISNNRLKNESQADRDFDKYERLMKIAIQAKQAGFHVQTNIGNFIDDGFKKFGSSGLSAKIEEEADRLDKEYDKIKGDIQNPKKKKEDNSELK